MSATTRADRHAGRRDEARGEPARGRAGTRGRAGARDPEGRAEPRARSLPARARECTHRPRRRGDRGTAPDGEAAARPPRGLAPARRPPDGDWRHRRRRRRLPAARQGIDAQPGTAAGGGRDGEEGPAARRGAAEVAPHQGADRRAGDPDARRGRGAPRPRRRRHQAARALPRARAKLQAGALQLRDAAAPPQRLGPCACRSWNGCSPRSRATRAIATSTPCCSAGSANMLERAASMPNCCGVSVPGQGLAELRPHAQDRRQTQEGIDAYRSSIALEPTFGEAYWSLANLKTFRFDAAEIAAMEAKVADPTVGDVDRLHFHFALGKAYEDEGDWAQSFEHYAKGNALNRARSVTTRNTTRSACSTLRRRSRANSSRTRRFRLPVTGPYLHRRPAARGIDADRADPFQPFRSRRHDGTARDHLDGAGTARRSESRGPRRLYRRAGRPGSRRSCASSASGSSSRRASTARRTDRSSSTRCRTTSCTSA